MYNFTVSRGGNDVSGTTHRATVGQITCILFDAFLELTEVYKLFVFA